MERTSLPGVAPADAQRPAAGGLRGLRLLLEPVSVKRLALAHAGLFVTVLMAAGAAWLFAASALQRHASFHSNAYDLGFFDQIIWNTSQGRLFETSFVKYNFLGQHFDPILLLFAAAYRLGGGVETLLLAQALVVALAALPLYVAARGFTGSGTAAVVLAAAYLLSAPMHEAANFDFHPETAIFLFVFTAAAFQAYGRPRAAVVSLLPLLLIKEDMALVLIAIAVLIALRGHRREARLLAGIAMVWFVATVLIAMPLIRGGGSDLTRRYSYLVEDTTVTDAAPTATARAISHLGEETAPGAGRLLVSMGGLALLSPVAVVTAAPLALVSGLADHPQQAGLRLHYAVPTLALLWLALLLGQENLRRYAAKGDWRRHAPVASASLALVCAAVSFAMTSPFAPGRGEAPLAPQHEAALRQALAMVPDDASVQAQSAILPHLSQRRDVFEFPDLRRAEYVVLDFGLPVTKQSLAKGYEQKRGALQVNGYQLLFEAQGVEVWRLQR